MPLSAVWSRPRSCSGPEADPAEQSALTEIRRLRGEGATVRGIAAALNHGAYRTRRGTPWRLESIARVLKQEAAAR